MERFLQVAAGAFVAVILGITIGKQSKDMAQVLSIAVCSMVLGAVLIFLEPVIQFVCELQVLGQLDNEMMEVLLKAVGVGLIAEISALICTDCGNAALGKAIQILATATVLWLALPLMHSLMEMIEQIVGGV